MKAINRKIYNGIIEEYEQVSNLESRAMNFHRWQKLWYRNEYGIRASGIDYVMSYSEKIEWAECYHDIFYFIENYCKFSTIDGLRRITFRDYQKELISNMLNNRFFIANSSRQMGITISLIGYLLYHTLFGKDRLFVIYPGSNAMMSREFFDKFMNVYKNIPFYMKPGIKRKSSLHIEFENGVTLSVPNEVSKWFEDFDPNKQENHPTLIDEIICLDYANLSSNYTNELLGQLQVLTQKRNSKMILTATGNSENIPMNNILKNALKPETDPRKNSFKGMIIRWHQIPERGLKWMEEQKQLLGSEDQFKKEYDISLPD